MFHFSYLFQRKKKFFSLLCKYLLTFKAKTVTFYAKVTICQIKLTISKVKITISKLIFTNFLLYQSIKIIRWSLFRWSLLNGPFKMVTFSLDRYFHTLIQPFPAEFQ